MGEKRNLLESIRHLKRIKHQAVRMAKQWQSLTSLVVGLSISDSLKALEIWRQVTEQYSQNTNDDRRVVAPD